MDKHKAVVTPKGGDRDASNGNDTKHEEEGPCTSKPLCVLFPLQVPTLAITDFRHELREQRSAHFLQRLEQKPDDQ